MAFQLPVPGPVDARFDSWWRLPAAAVLVALVLLGGASGAAAAGGGQPGARTIAVFQRGDDGGAALRLTRVDPASRKKAITGAPGKQDEQDEPVDASVVRLLDRGRALLDRYDAERVLLAVGVGALVQVLCLFAVRFVGALLGIVTRVLTWTIGVAVALYLIDGAAWHPAVVDEAVNWIGRLVDLAHLIA